MTLLNILIKRTHWKNYDRISFRNAIRRDEHRHLLCLRQKQRKSWTIVVHYQAQGTSFKNVFIYSDKLSKGRLN